MRFRLAICRIVYTSHNNLQSSSHISDILSFWLVVNLSNCENITCLYCRDQSRQANTKVSRPFRSIAIHINCMMSFTWIPSLSPLWCPLLDKDQVLWLWCAAPIVISQYEHYIVSHSCVHNGNQWHLHLCELLCTLDPGVLPGWHPLSYWL